MLKALAEVLSVALIGLFPIWLMVAHDVVDRVRHRGEHPEQRALRRLAEQAQWTGGAQ